MSFDRKEIAKKGLEKWGVIPQMLMVAEESIELSHAVLKWCRAYKKYNEDEQDISKLNELEVCESNVILEASQVKLMLELLPLVIDQKYKWIQIDFNVLLSASEKVGIITRRKMNEG